jgi:hypothetical protein
VIYRGYKIAAELSRFLTTDHTDAIWIKPKTSCLESHPLTHPLTILGRNALVDSEPVNHGSHGYDLDKPQDRLSRIPSIPHPLRIRGKKASVKNGHPGRQL